MIAVALQEVVALPTPPGVGPETGYNMRRRLRKGDSTSDTKKRAVATAYSTRGIDTNSTNTTSSR